MVKLNNNRSEILLAFMSTMARSGSRPISIFSQILKKGSVDKAALTNSLRSHPFQ